MICFQSTDLKITVDLRQSADRSAVCTSLIGTSDTIGWVMERAKNLCHLAPKILFENKHRKKFEGEPANQHQLENVLQGCDMP